MAPGNASTVVVGRQAEFGRLATLARQVVAGRGAAVLVEGEPGIGKTTLLDAAADECARLGIRTFRGKAEDLEQRLPFAAVGNCLGVGGGGGVDEPGAARLAALLRGEGAFDQSITAANHELVVIGAILDFMDQQYARSPVALIVDDVQWADASSAVVLHRLGRRIEQQQLLMILAARLTPRSEALNGLIRSLASHGVQLLRLAALPQRAVASLAENLLGVPAGANLLRLAHGAGGNPMYVAELVAALSREGVIQTAAGVAEVAEEAADPAGHWVPRSLVDAIQRRLDFLPGKVRGMLEMAAVLGSTIDVMELSIALDMPIMDLSEGVGEAMAAGLLVDTGGLLAFRHDLIRQVLAEHQPITVRVAVRLRAGQALAAAGAPVERVAEHLLAGSMLEKSTVDWLVRSADSLITRAPELAVRLLRRVLTMVEDDTAETLRFLLARALLWAGLPDEAEQATQAALAVNRDPARDGPLRWLLAQARHRQGRLDEVAPVVEQALSSPHVTPEQVGRFHGLAAHCLMMTAQFEACAVVSGEAIAAGEASGDAVTVLYGCNSLTATRFMQEDAAEALKFGDRAMALMDAGVQPDLEMDPYIVRGHALLQLDRLGEADEAFAKSLRHNQRTGGLYQPFSYFARARVRCLNGRWDDALAEIEAGLDAFDPYHFGFTLPALATVIAIHRGTPPPHSVQVPAPADSLGYRLFGYLPVWANALVEEKRGNTQQALDLLYPIWERPLQMQSRHLMRDICLDLARLAAATDARERSRELATTTRMLADRSPSPSMNATALVCQGLAEADPDPLLAAAADFHQAGWPLCEGYAYENAAALFTRHGGLAEARDALGQAIARYGGLDAAWDLARAQARLRQAGIRLGRRGPVKRPKQGWEALTDTEHKVALLVAQGRSNPDIAAQMFLSSRTVQSHVSSILAKLQLSSRVEVAVSVSRHMTD